PTARAVHPTEMFKPALRWWWWAVAVVGVWLLLGADLTDAATVTVGSPLTAPFFSTSTCGSPCTRANTALADPGANVTSPITGTVVRYRLAGNYGGTFMLRVLRPAGGGQYTGAGTSGPTSANGTATIAIPTRLPIQSGDRL